MVILRKLGGTLLPALFIATALVIAFYSRPRDGYLTLALLCKSKPNCHAKRMVTVENSKGYEKTVTVRTAKPVRLTLRAGTYSVQSIGFIGSVHVGRGGRSKVDLPVGSK